MEFKTRYNFTPIVPRTFTESSKVDTLTFIPLEEKIMRFLQDGTQIHAEDEQGEYDIDQETPYQTAEERKFADIVDSNLSVDPTNSYPLDPMEMADLYNMSVQKVEQSMQNAKEAGREIAENNRKEVLKEHKSNKKMQDFAKALKSNESPKANS